MNDPAAEPCDHELISMSLRVSGSPPGTSVPNQDQPHRLRYRTSKLLEESTYSRFKEFLEESSPGALASMQEAVTKFDTGAIDRITLVNELNHIFTHNTQRAAKRVLGTINNHTITTRTNTKQPTKGPSSKKGQEPQHSQNIVNKIAETQRKIKAALTAHKSTQELDPLYVELKQARVRLRVERQERENKQLHQYLNAGKLSFTLTGPTVNSAWKFFQTIASKTKRRPITLPQFTLYNKLHDTDTSTWEASDQPAKTPWLSALAWEQFRYALGHHRRHHPNSPFDE